jgi:predicted nucleic acid-binding protein
MEWFGICGRGDSMQFDTDVLIWFFRGNEKAAGVFDRIDDRRISVITYMELLQGARNKEESRTIKRFLADYSFLMVPLTQNIGHRASIYMEEYALQADMGVADVLIAATAVENHFVLCTANHKHYKGIKDLELKIFRP